MKKKISDDSLDNQLIFKKSIIVWFIILLVGLLLAALLFINKQKNDLKFDHQNFNSQSISPKLNITQTPRNGSFQLISSDNKQVFLINKEFELNLVADSNNNVVSGYDIILNYDPSVLEFVSVESALPDMKIESTNVADGKISTTTVKDAATSGNVVFDNKTVANYRFKTLKQANFEISFVYAPEDTTESNLVIINAEDILGKVINFKGYVGSVIKITKEKQTLDEDIIVSLSSVELPDTNCRDCLTKYVIDVIKDIDNKQLIFEKGSLPGKAMTSQQIFNYVFEPIDFNQYEIMLMMAKTDNVN